MKTKILTCLFSLALALTLFGQTPSPTMSPVGSTPPTTPVSAAITPAISPTASVSDKDDDDDNDIERAVTRKLKRHFGVTIDGKKHVTIGDRHRDRDSGSDFDEGALMAIPIVGIIFTTLFGAPVLVVAAIMLFSYLKARSLHRTVRTMVEKGQEVPPALFAPPPIVRARSDMRRGVVLMAIGIGLMIFFGAVNDWEGGAWALGMIPFLIGAGYLTVWKLEGPKDKAPPLP